MAEDTSQTDETNFLVSSMIHVGDFLKECEQVIGSGEALLAKKFEKTSQEMAEIMETSSEIVEELEHVCSPSTLTCPAEKETPLDVGSLGMDGGMPPGTEHLKSLGSRHKKYLKVNVQFRRPDAIFECHATYIEDEEEDCVDKPTAILSVLIFRSSDVIHPKNVYRSYYVDREVLIPTDRKLTNLRDNILCAADMSVVAGEFSICPDAPWDRQHDLYKSSYFLIEDTFYNDFRDPLSTDLSKSVREWPKIEKKFHSKSMDDTTFNDLDIRLGHPYLYCHVGNCHHVIVFTDLRLLSNIDVQDLSQYPLMIHKPFWKRMKCVCCATFTAKWITLGDSFSTVDPSHFCDKCFRMLHYDKHGTKLGSFKAHPFTDPSIFS